jgi:hypothetical protein
LSNSSDPGALPVARGAADELGQGKERATSIAVSCAATGTAVANFHANRGSLKEVEA